MNAPQKPFTYLPPPIKDMWGEEWHEARLLHSVQIWTTVANTVGYYRTRAEAEEAVATALSSHIKSDDDR